MKLNKKCRKSPLLLTRPGVTLLELAVVISVLIMLLAFLFPVAAAWKRGSNRSVCIMNIRHVQLGVRSFSNLEGLQQGEDVSLASPPMVLQSEVIGAEKYVESAPACPSSGNYVYGGNVIPSLGTLYMTCSLAGSESHEPDEHFGW